jgi:cell division transport system permease protein
MRALRESLVAFRRAPLLSALGVTTIAFSLFAFGLFALVAINIREALRQVEERVEIRAFIVDGTSVEAGVTAMSDIAAFPEVAKVDYITSEQALERARAEMEEFQDVFEEDVLPASLEVRLKPGMTDPQTIQLIADRIRSYAFIDDIRYGQEWVEKLHRVRTIATVTGIILGLAFAAVAVIIIGATIRMAVLARAREISIMRLVGATDGFIRRPFLIEGFIKGVLGGALALLLTWFAASMISRYFIETSFFPMEMALLGLLVGALMGLAGSAVSVGRHLRGV